MTTSNQTQQTPNDGGSAFPREHNAVSLGMTLRDHFAGLALQGLLACNGPNDYEDEKLLREDYPAYCRQFAESAYDMADAMLKARSPAPSSDLLAALQEIAREDAGGFYAAIANKALAKAGVTP